MHTPACTSSIVSQADTFKARLSVATRRGAAHDPLVEAFVEHLVGLF